MRFSVVAMPENKRASFCGGHRSRGGRHDHMPNIKAPAHNARKQTGNDSPLRVARCIARRVPNRRAVVGVPRRTMKSKAWGRRTTSVEKLHRQYERKYPDMTVTPLTLQAAMAVGARPRWVAVGASEGATPSYGRRT